MSHSEVNLRIHCTRELISASKPKSNAAISPKRELSDHMIGLMSSIFKKSEGSSNNQSSTTDQSDCLIRANCTDVYLYNSFIQHPCTFHTLHDKYSVLIGLKIVFILSMRVFFSNSVKTFSPKHDIICFLTGKTFTDQTTE